MTREEIAVQLEWIVSVHDFAACSAELVENWTTAGVGVESVEPVLRFMEKHPTLEFGMPGALVHFVERFYGKGYEQKLVESVRRKPTSSSVWMLHRVINGTMDAEERRHLIEILEEARVNPLADQMALALINRFLDRLARRGHEDHHHGL